jgi:type I restriction enzyme S subunit
VINSPFGRQWVWRVVTQQVGQANVNGSKLKALAIPLPPSEEQRRCVETTEMLFSNANALEDTARREVSRIARLRQSILKSAFDGKLVGQDPADEPAEVLLVRIRAERLAAATESAKKPGGRKLKAAS